MRLTTRYFFIILITCLPTITIVRSSKGQSNEFVLSTSKEPATIYVGRSEKDVVKISALELCEDIEDITRSKPIILNERKYLKKANIIIGTIQDSLINDIRIKYSLPNIQNKWEQFIIRIIRNPSEKGKKVLLIIGSDPRGTAYGIFTVSRLIGISPWKWWADIVPAHKEKIVLNDKINIHEGPSVKYRGIFINDEDWGFRPWASQTYDPSCGNIGPKTYAKVFELLLRLRANTIWPAMHPGTLPFFSNKENIKTAKKYDIIIGTSHAEPMLRNNVGEWDIKKMGDFNYFINRDKVYQYWEERIKQVKENSFCNNVIFTLGMRGIHDSKMEGASTIEDQKKILSLIFRDQRSLISKYISKNISEVPQVFIPYKEVLPVYDEGLKVPEDVTLIWPDDNYGYIRRLSDKDERKREGSSGIYYHLSYWGRPHDYLWLSTTQPGLIWEEMRKAWEYGAKRIWIANVGDIKPAEFNIQLFLDLAWNVKCIKPDGIKNYMWKWYADIFGEPLAGSITQIMDDYYRLAFIRKPEFMGWNQVQPNTPIAPTGFLPFENGDEISKRITAYEKLIQQVKKLQSAIPDYQKNAYFELVAYPVEAAGYMNEKILYAQKSNLFARYHLPIANTYASLTRMTYDSIKILTDIYNNLADGKWKYMMNMAPRDLPVFKLPPLPDQVYPIYKGICVWLEGQSSPIKDDYSTLPLFTNINESHFFEIFNQDTIPVSWYAIASEKWIHLSKNKGILIGEDRIRVTLDNAPANSQGMIIIQAGNQTYHIRIKTSELFPPIKFHQHCSQEESNGKILLQAYQYSKKQDASVYYRWVGIQQLGYSDSAYMILPIRVDSFSLLKNAYLEYSFYALQKGPVEITVFTIPTHPVNKNAGMRIAISVDNSNKKVIQYNAEPESHTWKENVLNNHARCNLEYDISRPGLHTLRIYPLDPGVIIDQILIHFQGQNKY